MSCHQLLWQRCLLLAQFNGEELEGAHTYLSEAHIYLPAVFPFEKELSVLAGFASGQQFYWTALVRSGSDGFVPTTPLEEPW